jgi:hypothetical protein
MANPDIPIGFVPTPLERARPYNRDAASSTAIFFGDVTQMDNDGKVNAATAGNTALIGAALTFLTGSAAAAGVFADHPSQEFLAQDDGDTTTLAATNIGNNADHIATAGTMALKKSNHEIDADTVATGAAGFKLLDFVSNPDYSVGANSVLRVLCMEHLLNTTDGI